MIETGLIIAQVAFLVLVYLFVWLVVRSSARQLRDTEPARPAAPLRSPVVGRPEPVAAPVAEPVYAARADAPPPAAARGLVTEPAMEPVVPDQIDPFAPGPEAEPEPFDEEPLPEPPDEPAAGEGTPAEELGEDETAADDGEEAAADAEQPDAEGGPDAPEEGVVVAAVPVGRERRSRGDTGVLDLSEHLDPKLVVETSKVLDVGSEIALSGGLTIGRSGANDLSVEDPFVSHMHARILRRGPYHYVEDLGSTNGTFLNDQRVDGSARLKVRDTLRLGETTLRYEE